MPTRWAWASRSRFRPNMARGSTSSTTCCARWPRASSNAPRPRRPRPMSRCPRAARSTTPVRAEEETPGLGADGQAAAAGRRHRPPNAGKSTLINAILGEDRLLTGPEAGITRDAISLPVTWGGTPMRVFDTAGMRRKSRVQEKLEKLSVADGLRAVKFAEVVVVLLDAAIPVRDTGPAHRRSGRGRGPGGRDRGQQMGYRGRQGRKS
jgi:hypothetical protein